MGQNVTLFEPLDRLAGAQSKALAAILAGRTMTAAAAEAGVARTTLYRWVKTDPHFAARINTGRETLREEVKDRLLQLAAKATTAVEKALDAGDAKTALALLDGLGLLPGTPAEIGDTEPEAIIAKRAAKRARTKAKADAAFRRAKMTPLEAAADAMREIAAPPILTREECEAAYDAELAEIDAERRREADALARPCNDVLSMAERLNTNGTPATNGKASPNGTATRNGKPRSNGKPLGTARIK